MGLASPAPWCLASSRVQYYCLVLGPAVGRAIDNRGGRGVLALSNLVLRRQVARCPCPRSGQCGRGSARRRDGLGLYDSAFATLSGLYGRAARGPITGITLIAGFASTVGWPLSAFLDANVGWRGLARLGGAPPVGWAAAQPSSDPACAAAVTSSRTQAGATPTPRGAMGNSSVRVCCDLVRHRVMAAPFARLLEIAGASSTAAIAAALSSTRHRSSRLVEFGALRWTHPLVSTRIATYCIRSALSRSPSSVRRQSPRSH